MLGGIFNSYPMKKIKVGSVVVYNNNPTVQLTVVAVIKGEKTGKVVYHSGIMPNGYHRKPKRFKLSDDSVTLPDKLKLIK